LIETLSLIDRKSRQILSKQTRPGKMCRGNILYALVLTVSAARVTVGDSSMCYAHRTDGFFEEEFEGCGNHCLQYSL
jgi:hypothetical protein